MALTQIYTAFFLGVPQGTFLGPLLFLTIINDLPDSVTSSIHLFADDCVLFREIITELILTIPPHAAKRSK